MKKFIILVLIIILFPNPVFSKNTEKLDVKSNSFSDLGRYVETLEINDTDINSKEEKETDEYLFEEAAILDVAKRYEENSVDLKLDEIDYSAIDDINNDRIFKLYVNETQKKIETDIKNENMIYDSSKSFSQAFYNNSRHLSPIPAVINSSKITAKVSDSISASLGQTYLYSSNNADVIFIRANESTYNTGSVLSYKGDKMNLSVGSFSSSYNHAASGGAIISFNPVSLPKNTGHFMLGSALYTNEGQDYDKSTGGVFGQYAFKRLKLNAQIGQSKYSNSYNYDTSLYFIPELRISNSLYLKTRFIRNVSQHTMQDEVALTFKPNKNKNNIEFEINASNLYNETNMIKQRIKFSTSFRI